MSKSPRKKRKAAQADSELHPDESKLSLASLDELKQIVRREQRHRRGFVPLVLCVAILGAIVGRANRQPLPPPPEPKHDIAHGPIPSRSEGDAWLRRGLYEDALAVYNRIGKADDAIRYRMGLCQEALGNWEEAKESYRAVVSGKVFPAWAAAQVGLARVNLRSGSNATKDQLHDLFKDAAEFGLEKQPMFPDAVFLYGLALAADRLGTNKIQGGEDAMLQSAPHKWAVEAALGWIDGSVAAPTQQAGAEFRLSDLDLGNADDVLWKVSAAYPEHVLAKSARLEYANLQFLKGEFETAISGYAPLLKKPYSAESIPAAFNAGLAYRRIRQPDAARKAFLIVVDEEPGHPLVGQALLMVGRQDLEVGAFENAIDPLRRAVDLSAEPDVQAAAVVELCIAHTLIDNPTDRRAVGDVLLKHGDLVRGTRYQNAAALMNAYARFRSLTGERRDREADNLADALLSNPPPSRLPESLVVGRAYRDLGLESQMADIYSKAIVNIAAPAKSNGDIDLVSPRFLKIYSNVLDQSKAAAIGEMAFALAQYLVASGKWQQSPALRQAGVKQLESLAERHRGQWSRQALLRLAEIARNDGQPEQSVIYCFQYIELLDETYPELLRDVNSYERKHVLKLLGTAYEDLSLTDPSNRQRAIDSFAGELEKLRESRKQ